jgi:hypothetical protein
MGLRERLGALNMGVHGEIGVVGSLLRCMGWDYGKIL